MRFLFYLP